MEGTSVQETTGYAEGVEHAVFRIEQLSDGDLYGSARESADSFVAYEDDAEEEELKGEWVSQFVRGYRDAAAAAPKAAQALEP